MAGLKKARKREAQVPPVIEAAAKVLETPVEVIAVDTRVNAIAEEIEVPAAVPLTRPWWENP